MKILLRKASLSWVIWGLFCLFSGDVRARFIFIFDFGLGDASHVGEELRFDGASGY